MIGSLRRSPALRLAVKRLLQSIPVLLGVTFASFSLLNLLPGTAASALLGPGATPSVIRALELKLHLNKPFWERYFEWLGGVLHGQLGNSLVNGEPVSQILRERLPVSVELVALSFIIAIGLAVPIAVLAARKPGSIADKVSIVFSMVSLSLPNFVVGLFLILIFGVHLRIFPTFGFVSISEGLLENLKSVLLPSFTLALGLMATFSRLLRADIVEQMQTEDYIVTARAKGIPPWQILIRHALRNSLFGLITLVSLNLSTLIGGTVIIEQIFELPGLGQELLIAIGAKDVVMVEAEVVVVAAVVVLTGLLADLLYTVLDPRIRYGAQSS